ncbi:MAG TPA: hypothetical protein VMK13_05700 [Streptosporangiaceae bacterium]|nr:hypothetical protein [Streptosporangiaceae bacterium]
MRPLDAAELEQALTILAWSDPAFAGDPYAALPQLGVEMPAGFRLDIRVQRRDTLCLIIPPASPDGGTDMVVNQMDLWRSGDQFVWIMPQGCQAGLAGHARAVPGPRRRGQAVSGDRFAEHYRLLSTDPKTGADLLADPKAALAACFGTPVEVTTASRSSSSAPTRLPRSYLPRPSREQTSPRASPTYRADFTTCCRPRVSAAI